MGGGGGTHMFIYENGVGKIDPFLCTFGCKYNNTEELLNIDCTFPAR